MFENPTMTFVSIVLILIIVVHVIGWALAIIDHIGRKIGVIGKDETWWIQNP